MKSFKKKVNDGEYSPLVDVGMSLPSHSYYDAIEKIVMKKTQGCKHCIIPLIDDKKRNKMKSDFRKCMKQARFRTYRYDRDQLYRCHISALLLSECKSAIDKMTLDEQEYRVALTMAHHEKLAELKEGKLLYMVLFLR